MVVHFLDIVDHHFLDILLITNQVEDMLSHDNHTPSLKYVINIRKNKVKFSG